MMYNSFYIAEFHLLTLRIFPLYIQGMRYWYIVCLSLLLFFCTVFVWFWYWDKNSLINWLGNVPFPLLFSGRDYENWCCIFEHFKEFLQWKPSGPEFLFWEFKYNNNSILQASADTSLAGRDRRASLLLPMWPPLISLVCLTGWPPLRVGSGQSSDPSAGSG